MSYIPHLRAERRRSPKSEAEVAFQEAKTRLLQLRIGEREGRLAARAPGLDIFSQSFVLRDEVGWQITDAGRTILASLETPIQSSAGEARIPNAAPEQPTQWLQAPSGLAA